MGPYSLEEARALVLSGQLAATDWAWPDGAAQWVALKDVPGFTTGPGTAPNAGTPPPPPTLAPTAAEEELWSGHPSQLLNFKAYFFWTIIVLGTLSAVAVRLDLWPVPVIAAIIALIHITVLNLRLRSIRYVVTTQRVRIISGLLSKNIQEIELFRVKDTQVRQRIFQRLFGLGTIQVISGDASHPVLVLDGVPHAVELREKIRQEVMVLRQRYGVREMDVM